MLGPDHLETPAGLDLYKNSIKDFSVLATLPEKKVSAPLFPSHVFRLTPEFNFEGFSEIV